MKELNHPNCLLVKNILGGKACIRGDHFATLRQKKLQNMACSFQNIILRRRNHQDSQPAIYIDAKL